MSFSTRKIFFLMSTKVFKYFRCSSYSFSLKVEKKYFSQQNCTKSGYYRTYSKMTFQNDAKWELALDPFALRQFEEKEKGSSSFIDFDPFEFTKKINEIYIERKEAMKGDDELLKPGYAPFCKHFFVPNFCGENLKSNTIPINPDNEHLLKSSYSSRREEELAVLCRYFPKENEKVLNMIPTAKYLDIILYSREQIIKENKSMGLKDGTDKAPWGIISIKTQMVDYELPMQPITMMRNALGKEYGGSGVDLDKKKYENSVKFWSENASVS